MREEINAGRLVGPRLRAASPEITATGSLGDVRQLHAGQQERTSIELISDSPDEMRRLCRVCAREGCDTIKINIGGETLTPDSDDIYTTMTEEEVATAVQVAHVRLTTPPSRPLLCCSPAPHWPCVCVVDSRSG